MSGLAVRRRPKYFKAPGPLQLSAKSDRLSNPSTWTALLSRIYLCRMSHSPGRPVTQTSAPSHVSFLVCQYTSGNDDQPLIFQSSRISLTIQPKPASDDMRNSESRIVRQCDHSTSSWA